MSQNNDVVFFSVFNFASMTCQVVELDGINIILPLGMWSSESIIFRNDELSWVFAKRFRTFYLICRK